MSSRFSGPGSAPLVLPRRPTADVALGVRAWARALPVHTTLFVGGAIIGTVAYAAGIAWLGAASALAIVTALRLARVVRRIGEDEPLVAARVVGRRAKVLELRASP